MTDKEKLRRLIEQGHDGGSWDKPTKKYCEDCGAKMDGGDSDEAD